MSNKQLLSVFVEKMATDEEFLMKVAALQTKENVVELAATMGYEITLEAAEQGLEHIHKLLEQSKTLGNDDLEDVAGGFNAHGVCSYVSCSLC